MLISKKVIHNTTPPFLFLSAMKKWNLVSKISETYSCLRLELIENKNGVFNLRYLNLNEVPFYVGADIWELEYGSVLMTLNHPSLHDHPAITLWEQWIAYSKEV
jgi:hypothetical protein